MTFTHTKTAAFLFNRYAAVQGGETQPNNISEEDHEVLEAFVRRFEAQLRNKKEEP